MRRDSYRQTCYIHSPSLSCPHESLIGKSFITSGNKTVHWTIENTQNKLKNNYPIEKRDWIDTNRLIVIRLQFSYQQQAISLSTLNVNP